MPYWNMDTRYRGFAWRAWISRLRYKAVDKRELLPIEKVSRMLGWSIEKVRKKSKIQERRAFWIFDFWEGEYVYPIEVYREMEKITRKRLKVLETELKRLKR